MQFLHIEDIQTIHSAKKTLLKFFHCNEKLFTTIKERFNSFAPYTLLNFLNAN